MTRLLIALSVILVHASLAVAQQSDYKMSGPYEVVARDGEFRGSKYGSERDMKTAWV